MPKDPTALRQLEEDADSWALQQCVKGHVSLMGGMLPLLLDYYLSASPITIEGRSDHPADVKRIKAMFEGMQNALPQYRADIEKQGQSYNDFSRYLNQQIHDFQEQIRNDSPPIEELGERRPQSSSRRPVDQPPVNLGAFCGDVYGTRYCTMYVYGRIGYALSMPWNSWVGGHSAMISWATIRVSMYLVLMEIGCPFLFAQSQNLKLYSDEQELRRALSNLPTADSTTVVGNSPLKVYLNQGFGTQFNRPTSLTAVFCDRDKAFAAIQEGVSKVLIAAGYDVSSGWDKWGTLKASKLTDSSARAESLTKTCNFQIATPM